MWRLLLPTVRTMSRPITNENAIVLYLHCGLCLNEKPNGVSMREYGQLEIGTTDLGFQVWCKRHECNVVHIDYEGATHPANTTRRANPAAH